MSDQEPQAEAQPEPVAEPTADSPWETLDYVASGTTTTASFALETFKLDNM